MPQPCSQPLKTNPFESYRDPVTGQWKVRQTVSVAPPIHQEIVPRTATVMSQPLPAAAGHQISEEEKLKLIPKRRRWQKAGRPQKVASKEVA